MWRSPQHLSPHVGLCILCARGATQSSECIYTYVPTVRHSLSWTRNQVYCTYALRSDTVCTIRDLRSIACKPPTSTILPPILNVLIRQYTIGLINRSSSYSTEQYSNYNHGEENESPIDRYARSRFGTQRSQYYWEIYQFGSLRWSMGLQSPGGNDSNRLQIFGSDLERIIWNEIGRRP